MQAVDGGGWEEDSCLHRWVEDLLSPLLEGQSPCPDVPGIQGWNVSFAVQYAVTVHDLHAMMVQLGVQQAMAPVRTGNPIPQRATTQNG